MKSVLVAASILALAAALLAPALHAAGLCSEDLGRLGMTAGTVVWFLTAPFWIRKAGKLPDSPAKNC